MRNFYNSLSEKDRCCYVAIEATKLGYSGVSYIRQILGYQFEVGQIGMQT